MHIISYNGHSIRFEDIGHTRYVVLDDIASVFAACGTEVIPQSHIVFTSNQTSMDGLRAVRLAMIKNLFPLTDELSSLLSEAVSSDLTQLEETKEDSMFEDFRMTVEEMTEFLTDTLCKFVTEGSSDCLIRRLSGILRYLEDTEVRLDFDYC